MLTNPEWLCSARILQDEVGRVVLDTNDTDLGRLGVRFKRVRRYLQGSAKQASEAQFGELTV